MASSATVDKELRPFLAAAEKMGWRVRYKRRGGGVVVYPANGSRPIPLHGSISDPLVRNIRCQFKRGGADPEILERLPGKSGVG